MVSYQEAMTAREWLRSKQYVCDRVQFEQYQKDVMWHVSSPTNLGKLMTHTELIAFAKSKGWTPEGDADE